MIDDILMEFTPYIHKNKKLYEEEDVKKIAAKIIQKCIIKNNNFDKVSGLPVEQYPEATC